MRKVAFVCSANMCRSPMAEAIFLDEVAKRGIPGVGAFSAGTMGINGERPVDHVLTVLNQHGIEVPPEKVSRGAFQAAMDFQSEECIKVVVMEEKHREELVRGQLVGIGEAAAAKVVLMGDYRSDGMGGDISDPIGQPIGAFAVTYNVLRDAVIGFVERELV